MANLSQARAGAITLALALRDARKVLGDGEAETFGFDTAARATCAALNLDPPDANAFLRTIGLATPPTVLRIHLGGAR